MIEIWKTVKGFDRYEVSSRGSVRNIQTGKLLKPLKTKQGYNRVALCDGEKQQRLFIHRLVATAFIEPVPGKDFVLHWDADKTNNCVSNLRWGDCKDNGADSVRQGVMRRGEECHATKLTSDDVAEIRALAGTVPKSKIAKKFGVNRTTVARIIRREGWNHIAPKEGEEIVKGALRGSQHGLAKLTDEQVREIITLDGSITDKEIARRFGVSSATVSLICRGKHWEHVERPNGFRKPGKLPNAKLNAAKAREIKELAGRATLAEIADRYGVSKAAISMIHRGKTWKDA